MAEVPPSQCPSSAPAPPQGAPGSSDWLGAIRARGRPTGRPATASSVLERSPSKVAHFFFTGVGPPPSRLSSGRDAAQLEQARPSSSSSSKPKLKPTPTPKPRPKPTPTPTPKPTPTPTPTPTPKPKPKPKPTPTPKPKPKPKPKPNQAVFKAGDKKNSLQTWATHP